MRFRINFTVICLLATLAMSVGMAAQQTAGQNLTTPHAALDGGTQTDCLQGLVARPGLPLRLTALAPEILHMFCKPALSRTRAAQVSNAVSRSDDGGKWVTIDVPGALSTVAVDINQAGTITGYYSDANYQFHGFLRRSNGAITTFDVPNSVYGTSPTTINDAGEIAGLYYDGNFVGHGFLRSPNGVIATFDAPGSFYQTYPTDINDVGVIVGIYSDQDFVSHSFLRTRDGSITEFEVPGSIGSYTSGINLLGVATGHDSHVDRSSLGFLRNPNGSLTTFEVSSEPPIFVFPLAINLKGAVTGGFIENHPEGQFSIDRGFLRKPDGSIETFDGVPNPLDPCCTSSVAYSINLRGEIVGADNDSRGIYHGFLRDKNGSITNLDAPGAGTGVFQGTTALSINHLGVVTGYYVDANNNAHGFLWSRR